MLSCFCLFSDFPCSCLSPDCCSRCPGLSLVCAPSYRGAVCASPIKVGAGFSSKYLPADVEYLHCISRDQTIHGDFTLEMAIRGMRGQTEINQSTNQSINQSSNQSINQSINQSLTHSLNQPINQSINQSFVYTRNAQKSLTR